MSFVDFIRNDSLDQDTLSNIFGQNLDWKWINKIDANAPKNFWIWGHETIKITLASTVYDHLNICDAKDWFGWHRIWRLRVIPLIKIFIWKMFHGKLPTGAYLYDLNIGPYTLCKFCELEPETASHLFWNCSKTIACWYKVLDCLGLPFLNFHVLNSGLWITSSFNHHHKSHFAKALIVTTVWLIGKRDATLSSRTGDHI